MREQIKWVANHMPASEDRQLEIMSLKNVAKARFFHNSFPQYSVTPLARLDGMAKYLGLGGLFVKLHRPAIIPGYAQPLLIQIPQTAGARYIAAVSSLLIIECRFFRISGNAIAIFIA